MEEAEKVFEVLCNNRQALWTCLRLSIMQRFMYFLQLSPPIIVEPIATWLDDTLWGFLQRLCGFTVPRGDEFGGLVINAPVEGFGEKTFQEWQ